MLTGWLAGCLDTMLHRERGRGRGRGVDGQAHCVLLIIYLDQCSSSTLHDGEQISTTTQQEQHSPSLHSHLISSSKRPELVLQSFDFLERHGLDRNHLVSHLLHHAVGTGLIVGAFSLQAPRLGRMLAV